MSVPPVIKLIRVLLIAVVTQLQGCATSKGGQASQPDPNAVREASIMTNKCLLNHHDIPGSLVERQNCLNKASALLMNGYGPDIQGVAKQCAQKLGELAVAGDSGQIDLSTYQQKREMLKIECAQAAQAAMR